MTQARSLLACRTALQKLIFVFVAVFVSAVAACGGHSGAFLTPDNVSQSQRTLRLANTSVIATTTPTGTPVCQPGTLAHIVGTNGATPPPGTVCIYIQHPGQTLSLNLDFPHAGDVDSPCSTPCPITFYASDPAAANAAISFNPDTVGAPWATVATLPTPNPSTQLSNYPPNTMVDVDWFWCAPGKTPGGGCQAARSFGPNDLIIFIIGQLQITDNNTNTVVSDANAHTAIVGQAQNVSTSITDDPYILPSPTWEIDGQAVKNYDITTGATTPLLPYLANASRLQFYWTAPGTQVVRVYMSVGGVLMTTSATYNVIEPTVSVTATLGQVMVAPFNGCGWSIPMALSLGQPCLSPSPGITWNYTATLPARVGGSINMTQLVQTNGTLTPSNCLTFTNTGAQFWLDSQPQYGNSAVGAPGSTVSWNTYYDSPARSLVKGCNYESRTDAFRDFFMFQPTADNSGSSIWVTLERLEWSWSGASQYSSKTKSWGQPISPTANLGSPYGSSDLPYWPQ